MSSLATRAIARGEALSVCEPVLRGRVLMATMDGLVVVLVGLLGLGLVVLVVMVGGRGEGQ